MSVVQMKTRLLILRLIFHRSSSLLSHKAASAADFQPLDTLSVTFRAQAPTRLALQCAKEIPYLPTSGGLGRHVGGALNA